MSNRKSSGKGGKSGKGNANDKKKTQRKGSSSAPPPPGFNGAMSSSQPKSPKVDDGTQRIMRERMLYVTQEMVGLSVEVQLTNGNVYSGVLYTVQMNSQRVDIYLKSPKLMKGEDKEGHSGQSMMKFQWSAVVQLVAPSVNLERREELEGFKTDTEISGKSQGKLFGRKLETANSWLEGCADLGDDGLMDSRHQGASSWNQFEANEKLFGVQSSYDENLYTTKLNKSGMSDRQTKRAEKIAREIERQSTSNFHLAEERGQVVNNGKDYDEEARYSSVFRNESEALPELPRRSEGAYKPPSLRQSEKKTAGQAKNTSPKATQSAASAVSTSTSASTSKAKEKQMGAPGLSKSSKNQSKEGKDSDGQETAAKDSMATTKDSESTTVKVQSASNKEDGKTKDKDAAPKKGLNPNAKEFKLNASASSFTPSFVQSTPVAAGNSALHQAPYGVQSSYGYHEDWSYDQGMDDCSMYGYGAGMGHQMHAGNMPHGNQHNMAYNPSINGRGIHAHNGMQQVYSQPNGPGPNAHQHGGRRMQGGLDQGQYMYHQQGGGYGHYSQHMPPPAPAYGQGAAGMNKRASKEGMSSMENHQIPHNMTYAQHQSAYVQHGVPQQPPLPRDPVPQGSLGVSNSVEDQSESTDKSS